MAQIPFPDDALDLVVSTLSLHHWSDPVGVLDEIARAGALILPRAAVLPVFDLRRDMAAPFYLLLWFVTLRRAQGLAPGETSRWGAGTRPLRYRRRHTWPGSHA